MIVYVLSVGELMKSIVQLKQFRKEIIKFPKHIREDIFLIILRFLKGERLPQTIFKTFKLSKTIKVQEIRVKDHSGNWRAITFVHKNDEIVFVYAFHKKSQELLEKDRSTIIKRIKELINEK